MSAELLLPVRSIPPTAEHNATLHHTEPSRGKEKPVRLTGAWKSGMGPGGRICCMFFDFLDSIGCNLVFICFVDVICGQQLSCALRCPFRFLTFPIPFRYSWRPELSVVSPASTQNKTANQIAGIFSWTVNSAFIHENGKL